MLKEIKYSMEAVPMEINENDLGKIVQLSLKPEWGMGIINKIQNRFAYILFRDAKEKTPKKYLRSENPLNLAEDQDQPDLTKRARAKNKNIRPVFSRKAQKEAAAKE